MKDLFSFKHTCHLVFIYQTKKWMNSFNKSESTVEKYSPWPERCLFSFVQCFVIVLILYSGHRLKPKGEHKSRIEGKLPSLKWSCKHHLLIFRVFTMLIFDTLLAYISLLTQKVFTCKANDKEKFCQSRTFCFVCSPFFEWQTQINKKGFSGMIMKSMMSF